MSNDIHLDSSNCTIKKVRFHIPFTQIFNSTIQDPLLSWEAKGLLSYLLSLPDDWELKVSQLINHYQGKKRGNGRDGIRTILVELKEKGYVQFERKRTEEGKFECKYLVYPVPQSEFQKMFPQPAQPAQVQPAPVKPVVNKETNNKKINNKVVVVARTRACCDGVPNSDLTKDDFHAYAMRKQKGWTFEEIEDAYQRLISSKTPINDPFKYFEGIIEHMHKSNKSNNLKGDSICKPKSRPEHKIYQKGRSRKDAGFYSENDTKTAPLAIYARQNGLK